MNIALFEDDGYQQLLPLTWLRPACELCCGRDRLIDKITDNLPGRVVRLLTRPELSAVLAERHELPSPSPAADWCLINARAFVTSDLQPPPVGTGWRENGHLIALSIPGEVATTLTADLFLDAARLGQWLEVYRLERPPAGIRLIEYPWQLALANEAELARQCRDGGVIDGTVYPGAHLLSDRQIHVAASALVKPGAVLDAENGPIWIDREALILPNAVIEGPCYVGPQSIVRPGAVIRAGTTIGPVCRVGGEVEASIIHGYSNKQHDGFLGHSYLAEWVNIGADTITSDLKNTYGPIRVFLNGKGVETAECLIGAMIGDHSKTGIGTILPTGCVVGVASNVFPQTAVPKFVPSFAWLADGGMTQYRLDKAITIARVVMDRRDLDLSDAAAALLAHTAAVARDVERAGWA